MPYTSIMTNVGRNKEAAALANATPLDITHIAWGDGDRIPSGGETALLNEVGRKPVQASGNVPQEPNVAFFDILLDENEGPFIIREAGLFDVDGDLICVVQYDPPVNKPLDYLTALLRIHVLFSELENLILRVQSVNAFVPAERVIGTGPGLLGGGDLTVDRTLVVDFASQAVVDLGQDAETVISPLTLAGALGKTNGGLPLYMDLSNFNQVLQDIPENVPTRCNNMISVAGNMAALWNGHRFTVDADSLGVYGVLNRLNTQGENGEGARTYKNGVSIQNYQLSANAGTSNIMPFTHFVPLLNVGDYLEFFHSHYSSGSRQNQSSTAQIYRLISYRPPA